MDIAIFEANAEGAAAMAPMVAAEGDPADFKMLAAIPDILNGAEAAYNYLHVAAGLASAFHWPSAAMLAQLPSPTTPAGYRSLVLCMATIIRCSHAPASLGADATDLYCVVIGLARVVLITKWRIAQADIEPNQLGAVPADSLALAANRGANPYVFRGAVGDAADAAAVNAILTRLAGVYNNMEAATRALVIKIACATPITAGVTLVITQTHHFVDPHKQVARAVSGQVLGADVGTIAGLMKDTFEDAMFHKAAHPIKSSRLMGAARKAENKIKFARMGLASAVVRVPAQFAPERAISAARALIGMVAGMATEYNIGISTEAVIAALEAARPVEPISAENLISSSERVSAAEETHGEGIAWCYGFAESLSQSMPGGRASMTILLSHHLKRVAEARPASRSAGRDHFMAYQRWRREVASTGLLVGASVFGGGAPAARGVPREDP